MHFKRDTYTQTVLANSIQIPGELLLYGFTVYNSNASEQYVQLFDDGFNIPADGNVPVTTFPVNGTEVLGVYYGEAGRLCKGGVTLANSSTDKTKTIGSADCLFDVQFGRPCED